MTSELKETELRLQGLQQTLTNLKGEAEALGKSLAEFRVSIDVSARALGQRSQRETPTPTFGNVLIHQAGGLMGAVDIMWDLPIGNAIVADIKMPGPFRPALHNRPTLEPPKDQLTGAEVPNSPAELLDKGKRRTAKEKGDEG